MEFTETPRRAFEFTDAIGVRADLESDNGPNNYIDNFDALGPALRDLKIKYIRMVSQDFSNDANKRARVASLYGNYGIKFLFVFGNPIQQTIQAMKNSATAAVNSGAALGFEGPNEWSKYQYMTGNNYRPNWAQEVADYQAQFFAHLRGGPWRDGPIVAPSIWFRDKWAMQQLKDKGLGETSSVANIHYYHRWDQKPTETVSREPILTTPNPSDSRVITSTMDEHISDIDQYYRSGPFWVTETGEQTATGGETGSFVTDLQAAKYTPRLMMEFFKRNAQRIFLFELMDQGGATGAFGLMRNDATRRPVFQSVKGLMETLDDTGASAATFATQPLKFSLTGAGISHMLMQKSNGSYYLVLWRDVVSNDSNGQAIQTTLSWDFTASSVKSYNPRRGSSAERSWANVGSIPLAVRDELQIIEIKR